MSTHISAQPGDIAESILLPGDPLRAKYIAEHFLQDAVCFNQVRGMLGYTGTYKGRRVSVMGSGMGIPSMSIYATELMQEYGVQNLVRIGTCGSMNPDVHIRDVLLVEGACTDSDINRHIFSGTYCPVSDFHLLRTANQKAKEMGVDAVVGNVLSSDIFYNEELTHNDAIWKEYGVLAVEMEAAALLTLAKKHGRRALALLTVSDSLVSEEPQMTPEEREQSLHQMIEIALATVHEFSAQ